jgi:hypothetical protein
MNIGRYAKAFVGGAIAGLTALGTALGDNKVTASEWTVIAIATLVGLGAVWAVPNAKAPQV